MNPIYDQEAEAGILGCFLWEGQTCYQDAIAVGLKPEWFYDLRNKCIFTAIAELEADGKQANVITVKRVLGADLDREAGGFAYLAGLQNETPAPSYLPIWAERCRDAMLRRKAAAIASEALDLAQGSEQGEKTLAGLVARANEVLDGAKLKDSAHGPVLANALIETLEKKKALADSGQRSGIVTGLYELDKMTDGLQYGEQFIVGARPSTGKTAFGLSLVSRIAIQDNIPSLIISCEMSKEALVTRLCSICTGVSLKSLRSGRYFEDEAERIMTFNAKLAQAPLFIFDAISGATGAEVAAIVRQHARQHGVKFVLVDYLQKLKADTRNDKRTYEIADISGSLRSGAVAAKVAMMTLAQVNRDSEKADKPRPPRLHDLADSGQIERDADTVGLLHRDKDNPQNAMLVIAKQRDGETGPVRLHFNGPLTRFENEQEGDTGTSY